MAGDMADSDYKPDTAPGAGVTVKQPLCLQFVTIENQRSRACRRRKGFIGNRRIGNAPIQLTPRNPTGSCRSTADTALMIYRQESAAVPSINTIPLIPGYRRGQEALQRARTRAAV